MPTTSRGMLAPPDVGADSDQASKDVREMGLIRQAAVECNSRERLVCTQHQNLGPQDAPTHDVRLRACTEARPEGTEEMAYAYARDSRELAGVYSGAYVGIDVRGQLHHLPFG